MERVNQNILIEFKKKLGSYIYSVYLLLFLKLILMTNMGNIKYFQYIYIDIYMTTDNNKTAVLIKSALLGSLRGMVSLPF